MKKMNKLFGLWTLLLAIGGSCNAMSNSSVGTAGGKAQENAVRNVVTLLKELDEREAAKNAGIDMEKLIRELKEGEDEEHAKLVGWLMKSGVSPRALLIPQSCSEKDTLLDLYLRERAGETKVRDLLFSVTRGGKSRRAIMLKSHKSLVNAAVKEEEALLVDKAIELWETVEQASTVFDWLDGALVDTFYGLGYYMSGGRASEKVKRKYEKIMLSTIARAEAKMKKNGDAPLWMYLLATNHVMPYLTAKGINWNKEVDAGQICNEGLVKMRDFTRELYKMTATCEGERRTSKKKAEEPVKDEIVKKFKKTFEVGETKKLIDSMRDEAPEKMKMAMKVKELSGLEKYAIEKREDI
jgi:hypothetical protein